MNVCTKINYMATPNSNMVIGGICIKYSTFQSFFEDYRCEMVGQSSVTSLKQAYPIYSIVSKYQQLMKPERLSFSYHKNNALNMATTREQHDVISKVLYKQERRTIVVTHLNASTGQRIPVGIVTERDIIFRVVAQNRGPFKIELKDIMSAPIITIDADKSVEEAMAVLDKHQINRLPVVHDSSIIGIVTTGRILSNVSIEACRD